MGPLLVSPAGTVATQAGLNELIGPYGAALALLVLAVAIVLIWLRPDPMEIARELAQDELDKGQASGTVRTIPEILRQPAVLVAVITMVVGQAVMVMLI